MVMDIFGLRIRSKRLIEYLGNYSKEKSPLECKFFILVTDLVVLIQNICFLEQTRITKKIVN